MSIGEGSSLVFLSDMERAPVGVAALMRVLFQFKRDMLWKKPVFLCSWEHVFGYLKSLPSEKLKLGTLFCAAYIWQCLIQRNIQIFSGKLRHPSSSPQRHLLFVLLRLNLPERWGQLCMRITCCQLHWTASISQLHPASEDVRAQWINDILRGNVPAKHI